MSVEPALVLPFLCVVGEDGRTYIDRVQTLGRRKKRLVLLCYGGVFGAGKTDSFF